MDRTILRRDALAACGLALALGIGWTLRDWNALSALRLPDTDDAMRLQQVRDWLGGQGFSDLTQHRLGAGVPMHWSRLADLVPALLILALRPFAGPHGAELAAVIAAPLLLFAAALFLVARIARAVGAPAGTATVVAAIAYPATTVFLPGRIDHHGLQVVLLLGATLALLGPDRARRGALGGLLVAAGLTVGLETAPLLVVLVGAVAVAAIAGSTAANRRMLGFGAGLLAGLLAARAGFAPEAWDYPACDGFAADAWRAAMIGSGGLVMLGILFAAPSPARSIVKRTIVALVVGVLTGGAALAGSPRCLAPYGGVDPELARWWLARVAEAQPLFAVPLPTAIGYAGVMTAGLVATGWWLARDRSRGWALLMVLQIAAAAITLAQLRGAYVGAMLAAPALAATIAAARRQGTLPLATAWLGSAGMLYPITADALTPVARPTRGSTDCTAPVVMARLAALPPATLMAPIDVGAWAIAATPHRLVAGPYHRNNAGNLAMLRFFRADPVAAARIASGWRVGYVLLCDGDVGTLAAPRGSVARRIVTGRAPRWLRPVAVPGAGVHLFEVRHGQPQRFAAAPMIDARAPLSSGPARP